MTSANTPRIGPPVFDDPDNGAGALPASTDPRDTVPVRSAAPANGGVSAWLAVRDEVFGVLSAVSREQMSGAAALFTDRRRWFCSGQGRSGQGRSGLVAQMAAMRLMHVGFEAHAVGEATAPSICDGDGLVMISGSGETPVTLHLARLARRFGAHILAVTARADSTLARLADLVLEVPAGGTVSSAARCSSRARCSSSTP
jgi:6-phospho-3-hexuloisomerase